jgi:hypothetical protein
MTTLLQRTHSHVCIVFCKRHVLTSLCFWIKVCNRD